MKLSDLVKRLLHSTKSIYIINGLAVVAAVIGVLLILSSNQRAERVSAPAATPVTNEIAALQGRMDELSVQLRSQPEDAHLNIQMGNTLFDMRKYGEAVPYYNMALNVAPGHTDVWIDLGVCYFNLQMTDSAIVCMQRALASNPTHAKGLFNLGIIYYNMNQMDDAKRQWQKLIELHGDSPEAEIANRLLTNIKS